MCVDFVSVFLYNLLMHAVLRKIFLVGCYLFIQSTYAQNNCTLTIGDILEQIKNIKTECYSFNVEIPIMGQVYHQNNYDLVYNFLNDNIDSVDQLQENHSAITNSFLYIKHYFFFNTIHPDQNNQSIFLDVSALIVKILPTEHYKKKSAVYGKLPPIVQHINGLIVRHDFIDAIPAEIGKVFTRHVRFPGGNNQLVKRYFETFLFDKHCLFDNNSLEFIGEYDCAYYNKKYIQRFNRARKIISKTFEINQRNILSDKYKLTVRFFKNQSDWKRFGAMYFHMNNLNARSFYVIDEQTINTYETSNKNDSPSYEKILIHEYLHHVHALIIGKQMINDASFFWLREAFVEYLLLNDIKKNDPDKLEWLQRVKRYSVPSLSQLITSGYKDTNMQYTFGPILLNLLAEDDRYKVYFERLIQVQVDQDMRAYKNLMYEMKNDEDLQSSFKMTIASYKNNQ